MKYLLYRSFGNLEKDVKKHELVAVEYGKDIGDVTDALIKAAADDLAGMPEYERCETAAYAPEPIKDFRKVRRYQYEMTGIVYPPNADIGIMGNGRKNEKGRFPIRTGCASPLILRWRSAPLIWTNFSI